MYRDLIDGVQPEIVEQEKILDGTEETFRPTRLRYFVDNKVIDEVFVYRNSPKSDAWAAVKKHYFEEARIGDIETFRTWTISNHHERPDITRKMYLVELTVNTNEIRVTVIIKHFRPNGYKADIGDVVVTRVGTNNSKTYEVDGITFGERDYWDYLTTNGYTPYQLLDIRIPEMDAEGYFNKY